MYTIKFTYTIGEIQRINGIFYVNQETTKNISSL